MGLGPMPMGVPGGGLPPGMGAPPAPPGGGGMPPGMQAPPGNVGPHTIPQSNPGNIAQAMAKLSAAAQMVNDALPMIPLGTPLHTATLKVATDLNKHLGDAKSTMQEQVQQLMQAVAAQKQQGQMATLNRVAPPPNQPPAMAPPGAPPGGMPMAA